MTCTKHAIKLRQKQLSKLDEHYEQGRGYQLIEESETPGRTTYVKILIDYIDYEIVFQCYISFWRYSCSKWFHLIIVNHVPYLVNQKSTPRFEDQS